MIRRALISVYDKSGLKELGSALSKAGVEILSTGGTARALADAGIKVSDVSKYTGFPEMMGGRVKTLHPKVHGGLLASRKNRQHMEEAEKNNICMIDLVVVNLYPFEDTVSGQVGFDEAIEMIDIGGPSMIRSAAKNFSDVLVIIDPSDYGIVIDAVKDGRDVPANVRKSLACKVFSLTARYDSSIASYLCGKDAPFPDRYSISLKKAQDMRYGENPYQDAAFYIDQNCPEPSVGAAKQLSGKSLSYNNIMDADGALSIVKEFNAPCASVIKHANPSGVSVSENIYDALKRAIEADSLSAFGCVIALNRPCSKQCAEFLSDKFIEVIIAPSFDKDAIEILMEKKNRRLLELQSLAEYYIDKGIESLTLKKVVGGLLVQTRNFPELDIDSVKIVQNKNPSKEDIERLTNEARAGTLKELICVTKNKPSPDQIRDMVFAMKVCRHVKSNSVLYARNLATVGIGAGQMSRVDATIIATRKSEGKAKGAVMASDAFFPFRDGIDEAAKAGISAIIHPGGSIRDREVIDAANEHGIVMLFTGTRLFLH